MLSEIMDQAIRSANNANGAASVGVGLAVISAGGWVATQNFLVWAIPLAGSLLIILEQYRTVRRLNRAKIRAEQAKLRLDVEAHRLKLEHDTGTHIAPVVLSPDPDCDDAA